MMLLLQWCSIFAVIVSVLMLSQMACHTVALRWVRVYLRPQRVRMHPDLDRTLRTHRPAVSFSCHRLRADLRRLWWTARVTSVE